jgi:hypothetical protein
VNGKSYVLALVVIIHSTITLILGNDFTAVFDNDLIRFKGTHGTDTMASIACPHYFHTFTPQVAFGLFSLLSPRPILTFGTESKLCKWSITA